MMTKKRENEHISDKEMQMNLQHAINEIIQESEHHSQMTAENVSFIITQLAKVAADLREKRQSQILKSLSL
jgi:ABC-type transporter Mla subunit MlaD